MGTPATADPVLPSGGSTPAQRLQAVRDSLAKPAADILALGGERTRLIDALLGTVLLYAYLLPGPIAAGIVAMALLIGLSITRRPRYDLGPLGWAVGALFLAVAYAVMISLSGPDLSLFGWEQRAARLVAVIVFATALVTGRIHYPSIIRGVGVGLVANALLFYAGIAPAPYGSALSGYLLDKNQAGLAYAVIGILLVGVLRHRWEHLAVLGLFGALIWQTGSRTSLAALACGVIWFLARPRLAPVYRLGLGALMAYGLTFVEENYAQAGEFADRVGSDQLRERINEAASLKLQAAPWWGQGLGEAWVPLPQGNFLFHNSYWALLLEGGWFYACTFVGLMVLIGIRPFRRGAPPSALALSAEAGAVTTLVCALSLGEVFGATAGMLVMAAGFIGYLQSEALRGRLADAASEPAPGPRPAARATGAG